MIASCKSCFISAYVLFDTKINPIKICLPCFSLLGKDNSYFSLVIIMTGIYHIISILYFTHGYSYARDSGNSGHGISWVGQ